MRATITESTVSTSVLGSRSAIREPTLWFWV